MIKIEKGVPLGEKGGRPWKYKEYVDAFLSMEEGDSFTVSDYNIVDSVRKYAWKHNIPVSFRTISSKEYRIWRI